MSSQIQWAAVTTQVGATNVPVQNGNEPGRWRATTTLVDVVSGLPPIIAFKVGAVGERQLKTSVKATTKILTGLTFKAFTIAT